MCPVCASFERDVERGMVASWVACMVVPEADLTVGPVVVAVMVVHVLLSVGLMFAAPQAVENLSWLAMLVGVVVALKVHWLVLGFRTMLVRRVV